MLLFKLYKITMFRQGGPSSRSNHKICLDPKTKRIYVLGRFIERDMRTHANYESDFYRYDIICNEWEQLSENTFVRRIHSLYGFNDLFFF